jgi:hypothetical protein
VLVIIALAVASGVVGVMRTDRHTATPVRPAVPLDRDTAARLALGAVEGPGLLVDGQFIDARYGWVALLRCTPPEVDDMCALTYAVTDDGGATFRKLPVEPPSTGATVDQLDRAESTQIYTLRELSSRSSAIYMFDATHLVFDLRTLSAVERFASADGGRTFTRVPVTPPGSVDAVPASDLLARSADRLGAMAPDGTLHTLPHSPAGTTLLDMYRGRPVDGVLFAMGSNPPPDPADTRWFWVSDDAGATWQSSNLGSQVSVDQFTVIGGDGARLFATSAVTDPDGRNYRWVEPGGFEHEASLLVSIDHGVTWQRLPWPTVGAFADPNNSGYVRDMLLSYDGRSAMYLPGRGLFVSNGISWWRYDPATAGYVPVAMPSSVLWQPVAGALVSLGTDPKHPSASISVDGQHWNPVNVP